MLSFFPGEQLYIQRMAEVKRSAENSFTAIEPSQLNIDEEQQNSVASSTSSASINEHMAYAGDTTNAEEKENACSLTEEEELYPETPNTSPTKSISSEIDGDTKMANNITIDSKKEKPDLDDSDDEETHHGHVTTQNVEDENQEVYESNIDALLKEAAVLASGIQENKTYVSYWDCGGDDEYHATNHIHLSSDAVYIVAFNMSSMISDDGKGFPFMSII